MPLHPYPSPIPALLALVTVNLTTVKGLMITVLMTGKSSKNMFLVIWAGTYLTDLEVTPIIFDVDLGHATSWSLIHLHGLDAVLYQEETLNGGLSAWRFPKKRDNLMVMPPRPTPLLWPQKQSQQDGC